jgi:hypothetical protein
MTLAPALQPLQCDHEDCTLPQGGRCGRAAEFAAPLTDCRSLKREALATPARPLSPVPAKPPSIYPDAEDAAPWRGRHLDLREAEAIVQRSPARLISVLGPHNAGKTSLMASFFLQIANDQYGPFPYRFASSRTLYGFQDLVDRANRWSDKPGEHIVGHTPKEDGQDAGRFLHLGLRPSRPSDDRHIDVLLSDVAGEWIDGWTQRVDEDARRRLAFVRRSDGFVIVADADALMGRSGAKTDASIAGLIRRVAAEGPSRRVLAMVFSKLDRVIDRVTPPDGDARMKREAWGPLGKASPRIFNALDHAREAGFEVAPFAVSAFPKPLAEGHPIGVMEPFAHVMASADRRNLWPPLSLPVPEGASYFQAMRRREAEP